MGEGKNKGEGRNYLFKHLHGKYFPSICSCYFSHLKNLDKEVSLLLKAKLCRSYSCNSFLSETNNIVVHIVKTNTTKEWVQKWSAKTADRILRFTVVKSVKYGTFHLLPSGGKVGKWPSNEHTAVLLYVKFLLEWTIAMVPSSTVMNLKILK